LRKDDALASVTDESNDAAVVSALVIPAKGDGVTLSARRELMHSYHNVAKLRQIRGVADGLNT
jgi:hypothetical protein